MYQTFIELTLYFASWILLLAFVLMGLAIWRRGRLGKVMLGAAVMLLLAVPLWLGSGQVSWQLAPALVRGVVYAPNGRLPATALLPVRPDIIVERQLNALVGQAGLHPTDTDLLLTDFRIDRVDIPTLWTRWVNATLDTTLTFSDGSTVTKTVTIGTKGGSYINVLGKEVNRQLYSWYAPESSLARHLTNETTATPLATPLATTPAPLTLTLEQTYDLGLLTQQIDPNSSFVTVTDMGANGRILTTVDLRENQSRIGKALVSLQPSDPYGHILLEAQTVGGAVLSPDGERIAYTIQAGRTPTMKLMMWDMGQETAVSTVDSPIIQWQQQTLLFRQRDHLYTLPSGGETVRSVRLAPAQFTVGGLFQLSPDERTVAYRGLDGRVWLYDLQTGAETHIGWDAVQPGSMVWGENGRFLAYIAHNSTTQHGTDTVWLYDTKTASSQLLVQGSAEDELFLGEPHARFRAMCWLDETHLLLSLDFGMANRAALALIDSQTGQMWEVTPQHLPYAELTCEAGRVALNVERTVVGVFTAVSPIAASHQE